MILVDSSVWIAAFRSRRGAEARHLESLLDEDQVVISAPVRIEILTGASEADRARLRRVISALPLLVPSEASWQTVEDWVEISARSGERFGVMDLLIGVLSWEAKVPVWSLDRDFLRMERLALVETHRPPVMKL